MIYLDNAATSWPKPPGVGEAMQKTLSELGGSPGRAGHRMALQAGRLVYDTRDKLASLFNIKNPLQVVFTLNATDALNQAILGLLTPGDHVITSCQEHNAVSRPLHFMEGRGLEVTKVPGNELGPIDLHKLEQSIKGNTKALVINHASNVTGAIMPLAELGRLARKHDLAFIVDGAQTAGVLDIDVEEMHIDMLACTGHKGLLGPQGTGCLYVREGILLTPLRFGGTGSSSEYLEQPEEYPDRLESGTPNTVGIAGLGAGLDFINRIGIAAIREHEMQLSKQLWEGLAAIPGIVLHGPADHALRAPVISFTLVDQDPGQVGFVLDQVYGIACRTGLHCAPDAHRAAGTFPGGTVRLSLSYFNTAEQIEQTLSALKQIAEELNG